MYYSLQECYVGGYFFGMQFPLGYIVIKAVVSSFSIETSGLSNPNFANELLIDGKEVTVGKKKIDFVLSSLKYEI